MLEGTEGDAPEHPVLRWLLQSQLRDEMPKGHVLSVTSQRCLTNLLSNSCQRGKAGRLFTEGSYNDLLRATPAAGASLPQLCRLQGEVELLLVSRWSLGTCRCP